MWNSSLSQRYFKHLIDKVRILGEFVQHLFEHFDLYIDIHSVRSVQADQSSVNFNFGVLSSRSWTG